MIELIIRLVAQVQN